MSQLRKVFQPFDKQRHQIKDRCISTPMKTSPILAFLLLFWPFCLSAQPVLTLGQHQLQFGDTAIRQYYSFSSISPGPAGPNVTWDFSQLQPSSYTEAGEVQPVLSLPIFAMNHLFTIYNLPFAPQEWYMASGDSLTYAGHNRSALEPDIVQYWNSDVLLRLPMAYGDQHSDTYWGTTVSMLRPPHFSGTSTIHADGHGTLLLPGTSYTDVLRVHKHDVLFDSVTTSTFDTWYYYSASHRFPVLVYGDGTYFGGTYAYTTETRAVMTAVSEAAAPARHLLEILGQPVQDEVRVRTHAAGSLSIHGTDGRLVFQREVRAGTQLTTVPFADAAPGLYVASLSTSSQLDRVKLVKLDIK
jgi:hypothetical protein